MVAGTKAKAEGSPSRTDARPFVERRSGRDRRKLSLRSLVQGGLLRRRRRGRRWDDHHQILDWHEPLLFVLALAILLLSITDALMTLTLLTLGAEEANPFLDYVLTRRPEMFAGVKLALTGGPLVVLAALARARLFRVIRVRTVLHCCVVGYVMLVAYEWWLFQRLL